MARRDLVYRLGAVVVRTAIRLTGTRLDLRGLPGLPEHGPAVLACNHIGFLDWAFVGLAADRRGRRVRFLIRAGVFRPRLLGALLRSAGQVPVDRASGARAYRTARDRLAAGELVGVFPEGTISRAWTLKPFSPGAAALAVGAGVPLIPMVTWGGHRLLTVDGHRSLRRRLPVSVWVGEPIVPLPGRGRGRAAAAEASEELRRRIQDLLDAAQRDYPDRPRDVAGAWWQPRHLGGSAPDPATAAALDAERRLD